MFANSCDGGVSVSLETFGTLEEYKLCGTGGQAPATGPSDIMEVESPSWKPPLLHRE